MNELWYCIMSNIVVYFGHPVLSKVKYTLVQALRLWTGRTAHGGSRGIALLFLDHSIRRGRGVSVTLQPLFTPGKDPYPLYRKLFGPQSRSGRVRKFSPQQEFDPRTVEPVTSRYTDWAAWPTFMPNSLGLRMDTFLQKGVQVIICK